MATLTPATDLAAEAADPGQDARTATGLAPLSNVLHHTPEGRVADYNPELSY